MTPFFIRDFTSFHWYTRGMFGWKLPATIAALLMLVAGPSLGMFFVSDDFDWLSIALQGEPLWKAFVGNYYGQHGVGGTFRPMVNVFFELMTRVGGLQPALYHAVQLAVHGLNAWLVAQLATRLWRGREGVVIGWLAAVMFVVMAQHAEAIFWIAAIGDPLATAGVLGALLCYVSYRHEGTCARQWRIVSSILLVAALLTKEIALVFPVLIVGYELLVCRTFSVRSLVRLTWQYWLMVVVYLLYRWWAIGLVVGYYAESSLRVDLLRYVHNLIAYDVGALFVGAPRIWLTTLLQMHWYVYGVLALFALGVVVRWAWRGVYTQLVFAVFFWLVNIALVTPLSMSMLNDEGERYGYLASVAIAWLLAWMVYEIIKARYWIGVAAAVVVMSYHVWHLDAKLGMWRQAGHVSSSLTAQLANLPFEQYKKNYLIGLPDTLDGAAVMRNGAVQAAALLRDDGVVLERVPVYTLLPTELLYAPIYSTLQRLPDGAHFTVSDEQYLITGNATESHPEYRFELWNYDYEQTTSNTIRIQFQGGREFDWARAEIALWYYEEGVLKRFEE